MRPAPLFAIAATACLVGCGDPDPIAETHAGDLAAGDLRHHSDQSFYDEYTFEAAEGYRIEIEMESEAFDTFVHLHGPDEIDDWQNDDRGGDDRNSRLITVAPRDGTYAVWANSHDPGETGTYVLRVRTTPPAE